MWEEDGKYPNVIVELLSDSTVKTDRGLKKQIYQDTFRTPDYGIYNNQLRFFTPEGKLVPTPEERNEKLAAKLRELGVDPDDIEL